MDQRVLPPQVPPARRRDPLTPLATAAPIEGDYSQTTQQTAAVDAYTDNLSANVVITSDVGALPDGLFDEVRSAPRVTAASELVRSTGWIEEPYDTTHTSDAWPLLGLNGPVYKGKVHAGSLEQLTGDTVALPPGAAKKLKVGIGDEIGVRLGDDALVKVKIVALVDGTSGCESILLPSALLVAIAIAYTAIASINTIAVAVLDRRREFGLQRLTGFTRRQVVARRADGRGQLPSRLITRRS
ncbi:hypothetical protein [Kribbella sp. VKM Ac-2568]|uniref:hypothetical protein n=1 Tax=Kribbella sp. VKM Ac-2568 TaxID=2512219 RepID=UPI0010D6D413|nr:hypothetical protein [Kribbella sp. VKM Ac-2568]TCM41664.1 hypothetical protein EV648_11137 [Kribbella sp. VKM Ac-2568]